MKSWKLIAKFSGKKYYEAGNDENLNEDGVTKNINTINNKRPSS
jgi:hypothetical protein